MHRGNKAGGGNHHEWKPPRPAGCPALLLNSRFSSHLKPAVGRIAAFSDFCWNLRRTAGVSMNPPTLLHRADATKAPTQKPLLDLIVGSRGIWGAAGEGNTRESSSAANSSWRRFLFSFFRADVIGECS